MEKIWEVISNFWTSESKLGFLKYELKYKLGIKERLFETPWKELRYLLLYQLLFAFSFVYINTNSGQAVFI